MLLILSAVILSIALSIAVVIILRSRASRAVNGTARGEMSEQWLAEQQRSHSA